MAGFLRAILFTVLAGATLVVFINLAYFFPWYMVVVETTYEVSQMIATDNYLSRDNYDTVYNTLSDKPIFKLRRNPADLSIKAYHENTSKKNAIEGIAKHSLDYYYNLDDEDDKPYVQMGELVTITIHATYPFQMEFMGKQISAADVPVTFTMTTTTLKHYKDLEYEYAPSGSYEDDDFMEDGG